MFTDNFFFILMCGGMLGVGVIFFAFIILMRYIGYQETLKLADRGLVRPAKQRRNGKGSLRWGIIISALGLAVTLGLLPLGVLFRNPSFPLGMGPWMVIGLLPLFFGLALILVYILVDRDSGEEPEQRYPTSASKVPTQKSYPDLPLAEIMNDTPEDKPEE